MKISIRSRFRAKWSEGEPIRGTDGKRRAKLKSKSFFFNNNYQDCERALKEAILYRNAKCKENGYILDERSTTIETTIINNPTVSTEELLEIDLNDCME